MTRFFIPVFFLLVSSVIYITYIDPTYAAIMSQQGKADRLDSFIAEAKDAEARIVKFQSVKDKFPKDYEKTLETILPTSVDPLQLIIDINGMAKLRGLHAQDIIAEAVRDDNAVDYNKNTVKFSVTAPYDLFRDFLRDLEGSLLLHDTASLSFKTSEQAEDGSTQKVTANTELEPHDYDVSIITYSLAKQPAL